MTLANISELSETPASNPDLAGISILGTGLVSTADDSFRTAASFLKKWWDDLGGVNTVAGTGDAITVTTLTVYTTLKTGMRLQFKPSAANTTAVTLNLDAIGAKAVRKISGGTDVALVAGDLTAASPTDIVYLSTANAAAGAWILVGSAAIPFATSGQALAGTSTAVALDPANLAQERTLGVQPMNLALAASVGSSALTVSLKGIDGNDPSATNPVTVIFRNATLSTGTPVSRLVTAATSIVVASTKTLGTVSATIARLWIVAVDTGSGIELGIVNCLSGTSIMALRDGIYSPTATPGNSAQVIYTTSGQTSKPIAILGYIEATEATAGTWATAPSTIKLWQPGDPMPGDVLQNPRNAPTAAATGSTTLPNDDTIPQNTEGDQYMTQAITPVSGANLLRVTSLGNYSPNAAAYVMSALFRDSTANALAAVSTFVQTSNGTCQTLIQHLVLAASTTATTFKVRTGQAGAVTITFNGTSSTRMFGGVASSFTQVEELMS